MKTSGKHFLEPLLQQAGQTLTTAGWNSTEPALVVVGATQRIYLLGTGQSLDWPVSTAAAGFGNRQDSGQTPIGLHRIAACIGEGAPCGTVFKSRVATGEVVTHLDQPGGDYITTRILWLEGVEAGFNQGPGIDSKERFIYIHGTPYTNQLGKPGSAGCIRMDNQHILELLPHIQAGNFVLIIPSS